jgi:hypothetical protein
MDIDKIRAEAKFAFVNFREPNGHEQGNPAAMHFINECRQTIQESHEALADCPGDATEYAERHIGYIRRAVEARKNVVHYMNCGQYWRTPHSTQAERPSPSDPFSASECRAYLHAARAAQ